MPDTDTHTATAHLGQGVWAIYHQATQPYAVYSGIYLLLPCPCGDYIETEVPSDELLAETLENITRWQADPASCTDACSSATCPPPGPRAPPPAGEQPQVTHLMPGLLGSPGRRPQPP
ncbi:hypothetical protein GXW82_43880 [Streptacidiphilus sp. 4-A2]|nr:hypothetical protein [Streptacidiphilus sp. 4-A2]